MSEWNYNLEEAPLYEDVLVTRAEQFTTGIFLYVNEGYRTKSGAFERPDGKKITKVIAWMPLPDPAAMPEVTA